MSFLLGLLVALQEDPATLVERLGSDRVEERDQASRALKALGAAALPELGRHADHSDPEVRARVRGLVRVLRLRESLPAALSALDDLLERGDWRGALRASPRKGTPKDRAALAALALDIARRNGELPAFCELVLELDDRSALPALRSLQFSENAEVRSEVQKTLLGLARKATLGTTLFEQRIAVPLHATVDVLGHRIGSDHRVAAVQTLRLAVIDGKVYEEGSVLPDFGVRIHRIWAHGVELRPLTEAPREP